MNSNSHDDSKKDLNFKTIEKSQELITEIKVLEERMNNYKEIFDGKLNAIKQLYGVVIIILTLIGIGTIATIIVNIVRNTAENALESILTPKYIEDKIYEKSDPVLNKIIDDIEIKVTDKIRDSLSYNELMALASEESILENYESALSLYKKAQKKILAIGPLYTKQFQDEYLNLTICMVELEIILGKFKEALATLEDCKPEGNNKNKIALYYFHKCIIEKILKQDVSQSQKELESIIQKENFILTDWYFESLKNWVNTAQLSEDNKNYIKELIEKIEKYKK